LYDVAYFVRKIISSPTLLNDSFIIYVLKFNAKREKEKEKEKKRKNL